MADSMVLPVDNGFGGSTAWGAGFGGFLGSVLGNGGFGWGGGFGGNRGQAVADLGLANAVEHVSDQVTQGTISNLQSSQATQNAIAGSSMANVQAQNASTMATMQGNAALSDKICCSTGRLSQEIDQTGDNITTAITDARVQSMQNTQGIKDGLCVLNNNITGQAAENRLLFTQIGGQLQMSHADIKSTIQSEACATRELARQIQYENTRDELTKERADNAALKAQINVQQQLASTAQYIISQSAQTAAAAAVAAVQAVFRGTGTVATASGTAGA